MLYYGYRYYNPSTGRWQSRDPLQEESSFNVYSFINNDSFNKTDFLGLSLELFEWKEGIPIKVQPTSVVGGVRMGQIINLIWTVSAYKTRDDINNCFKIISFGYSYINYTFVDKSSMIHEKRHVDDYHKSWWMLAIHYDSYSNKCMCEEQADCYINVITLLMKDTYLLRGHMLAARYDCMTYGRSDPMHPKCMLERSRPAKYKSSVISLSNELNKCEKKACPKSPNPTEVD